MCKENNVCIIISKKREPVKAISKWKKIDYDLRCVLLKNILIFILENIRIPIKVSLL